MGKSATKIILDQIGRHGLAEPVQEYEFSESRKWRFDLAWPDIRLAFEIEGGAFINGRHTRGKGFSEDICKYNRAGLDGWTVLRATTAQIKSGQAFDWLFEAVTNGS